MTQESETMGIRVNGEVEPLVAATLATLLADKAVDVAQRGIAVALNGSVVPRSAWSETRPLTAQPREIPPHTPPNTYANLALREGPERGASC